MFIDVHGHAIENMLESAGQYGPRYVKLTDDHVTLEVGPYRTRPIKSLDFTKPLPISNTSARLAEMARRGIDHLIQSTSPLFYLYWAELDIALESVRIQNEALHASSAANPDRLSWSATLPLQDVDASIAELKYAIAKGARAVSFGTDGLGTREVDDPDFWPLYQAVQDYDIPIIFHPHPLPMATGGEDRYNLSWVVGYNYSETMAFSRLVLGGVFDDFPKLKVVLPHGGGAVPYQIGRIEEARKTQMDNKAKHHVEDYFGNVFFELLVHDVRARRLLVDVVGASQIVIGSNFGGWDSANGIAMLEELDLPSLEHDMIAHKNAAGLFHLQHLLPNAVV